LNFYRQNKTSNSTTNSPKKISALKHLERTDLWPPREDRYRPPTPETILIKEEAHQRRRLDSKFRKKGIQGYMDTKRQEKNLFKNFIVLKVTRDKINSNGSGRCTRRKIPF
jgi:hypothetical protein